MFAVCVRFIQICVLSTGGYGFKFFSVLIEVFACIKIKKDDEIDSPETEPPTPTPAAEQMEGGNLPYKTYCIE